MRTAITSVLLLQCAWSASAQPTNPDFVDGREYSFERMVAARNVGDAQDSGTITSTNALSSGLRIRSYLANVRASCD